MVLNEHLRRLGEFDPEVSVGHWALGVEHKLDSLRDKYAISYTLNEPASGSLSRARTEGQAYRLLDRLASLAGEFQERCN